MVKRFLLIRRALLLMLLLWTTSTAVVDLLPARRHPARRYALFGAMASSYSCAPSSSNGVVFMYPTLATDTNTANACAFTRLYVDGSSVTTGPSATPTVVSVVGGSVATYLAIIGITNGGIDPATRIPLHILVQGVAIATNGALQIYGSFPPQSNLTVRGCSVTTNSGNGYLTSLNAALVYAAIYIGWSNTMQIGAGAVIDISANTASAFTGAAVTARSIAFGRLTLAAGARVTIRNNTVTAQCSGISNGISAVLATESSGSMSVLALAANAYFGVTDNRVTVATYGVDWVRAVWVEQADFSGAGAVMEVARNDVLLGTGSYSSNIAAFLEMQGSTFVSGSALLIARNTVRSSNVAVTLTIFTGATITAATVEISDNAILAPIDAAATRLNGMALNAATVRLLRNTFVVTSGGMSASTGFIRLGLTTTVTGSGATTTFLIDGNDGTTSSASPSPAMVSIGSMSWGSGAKLKVIMCSNRYYGRWYRSRARSKYISALTPIEFRNAFVKCNETQSISASPSVTVSVTPTPSGPSRSAPLTNTYWKRLVTTQTATIVATPTVPRPATATRPATRTAGRTATPKLVRTATVIPDPPTTTSTTTTTTTAMTTSVAATTGSGSTTAAGGPSTTAGGPATATTDTGSSTAANTAATGPTTDGSATATTSAPNPTTTTSAVINTQCPFVAEGLLSVALSGRSATWTAAGPAFVPPAGSPTPVWEPPTIMAVSHCAVLDPTTITCAFDAAPPVGTFRWALPAALLTAACANASVTVAVTVPDTEALNAGSATIQAVLLPAALAALPGFLGDPLAIEVVAAVMLLAGPCASEAEQQAASPAQYLLSPFASTSSAAIVGAHVGIGSAAIAAHAAVTFIAARRAGIDFVQAWPTLRFPSVSFVVAAALYPGAVWGVARGIHDGSWAAVAIGALYLLALPALAAAVLLKLFPRCRFIAASSDQSEHRQSAPWRVVAWLRTPSGRWAYDAPTDASWGDTRDAVEWLHGGGGERGRVLLFPVAACLLIALAWLSAAPKRGTANCRGHLGTCAAIALLAAAAVAAWRPHRHALSSALSAASFMLLGLLYIVFAAASSSGPKAALVVIIAVLSLVRLLHILVVNIVEWRRGPLPTNGPHAAPPDGIDHTAAVSQNESFGIHALDMALL